MKHRIGRNKFDKILIGLEPYQLVGIFIIEIGIGESHKNDRQTSESNRITKITQLLITISTIPFINYFTVEIAELFKFLIYILLRLLKITRIKTWTWVNKHLNKLERGEPETENHSNLISELRHVQSRREFPKTKNKQFDNSYFALEQVEPHPISQACANPLISFTDILKCEKL